MTISDILNLSKEAHSLVIIKNYLSEIVSIEDASKALFYYIQIANSIGEISLAIEESNNYLENKNFTDDYAIENVITILFNNYLLTKDYSKIPDLLEKKKEILPELRSYEYYFDLIKFKKILGEEIIDYLNILEKEPLPLTYEILLYEDLYYYYKNLKNYEKAIFYIKKLTSSDAKSNYFGEEIELLYLLGEKDDLLDRSKEILANYEDANVVFYYIKVNIEKRNSRNIEILEPQYENLMSSSNDELKLKYYAMLVEYYKDNKRNKVVYEHYLERLEKLKKVLAKKEKNTVSKNEVLVERIEPHLFKILDLDKNSSYLFSNLEYLNGLDLSFPFREILRLLMINLSKNISYIYEYIIYLPNNKPNYYRFFRERLFEKNISELDIELTPIFDFIVKDLEIDLYTINLEKKKNIATSNLYKDDSYVKRVICIKIGQKGALLLHIDKDNVDNDTLFLQSKTISNLIDALITNYQKNSSLIDNITFFQKIIESDILPLRTIDKMRTKNNKAASILFGIDESFYYEMFWKNIKPMYQREYLNIINYLFDNPKGEVKEITYEFSNLFIKEKMISLKKNDIVTIFSVFFDITDIIEDKETSYKISTLDYQTKLYNMPKFYEDLVSFTENKVTFVLIELENKNEYLYDIHTYEEYFREFTVKSKSFLETDLVYLYSKYKILVVIPLNDIRKINNVINTYNKKMSEYVSSSIRNEKFYFYSGIVRYPTITSDKNFRHISIYLDIALNKAKSSKYKKEYHFAYKDYEDYVYRENILKHINLAIENDRISLNFATITNLDDYVTFDLIVEPSILGLDVNYKVINEIAKSRSKTVSLEKCIIIKTFKFLSSLIFSNKVAQKLSIPISLETYLDENILNFFEILSKDYRVPLKYISLIVDFSLSSPNIISLTNLFKEKNILVKSRSFDSFFLPGNSYLFYQFKDKGPKELLYLQELKKYTLTYDAYLIVYDVKDKESLPKLYDIGIKLIESDLFKKFTETELRELLIKDGK
ncbi:MAG: hypothetical protein LBV58_04930 [Acholeplasmatales bacterium]|jgi:hypothetical protein|nr:hypothetical protein [Acholeplasmatales bacterium]